MELVKFTWPVAHQKDKQLVVLPQTTTKMMVVVLKDATAPKVQFFMTTNALQKTSVLVSYEARHLKLDHQYQKDVTHVLVSMDSGFAQK